MTWSQAIIKRMGDLRCDRRIYSLSPMSLQQYQRRRSNLSNLESYIDFAQTLYNQYRKYEGRSEERRKKPKPMPMPPVVRKVPFNVRQYTKRMINRQIETKHVHINMSDRSMLYLNWYYFRPLQAIAPGTGEGQRIGDTITNVFLDLGIYFTFSGLANFCNQVLRVMIVATDKEISVAPGAWAITPTTSGNFDTVTASGFHVSSAPADKSDYVILYDRKISVAQTGAVAASPPHKVIRIRKKLCQRAVYKEELIGGISYNKIRNYYVLVGASGESTTGATSLGSMQCSGFVYFKDG